MNTAPKSILIVDNEPQVCLQIGDQLSMRGFDCHSVTDSEEAKELLQTEQFDLLIADIAMPGVGSLDLLTSARRHTPECKVLLVTGMHGREYLAQALMLGAFDYVEKPFNTDQLAEAARRALSNEADVPALPMRAAAALEMSERTKQAALDSVRALARAVEAKNPYTRRHSEHVAHYATNLARRLNASAELVQSVRVVALLHDVGKIGIPDYILSKPGRLTEDEFEYVRRHPGLGADILSNISLFGQEALSVRHHHEHWDGNGYPDGLMGKEIPWPARVINVADSMDAMLMERSYKEPYAIDRMLTELRSCAGTQFDPEIASAAVAWAGENVDKLILPNRPIEALSV
ncbi:MAG: response regulator [Planctomycetes bacterium]|nr:response regulator [Planctomycetota bacterium]